MARGGSNPLRGTNLIKLPRRLIDRSQGFGPCSDGLSPSGVAKEANMNEGIIYTVCLYWKEHNPHMPAQAISYLQKLFEHGHTPVGYTYIMGEHTFIFNSETERDQAVQEMEVDKDEIQGWWYAISEMPQTIQDVKNDFDYDLSYFYFADCGETIDDVTYSEYTPIQKGNSGYVKF